MARQDYFRFWNTFFRYINPSLPTAVPELFFLAPKTGRCAKIQSIVPKIKTVGYCKILRPSLERVNAISDTCTEPGSGVYGAQHATTPPGRTHTSDG